MIWLKRILKFFLAAFLVLLAVYGVARLVVVYSDSRLAGARAPYIQLTTPDSAVIRWQTLDDAIGTVRYGETLQQLNQSVAETVATTIHEIRIARLKPDTAYFYAVTDDQGGHYGATSQYWFRTAPVPGVQRPTRIWVIGDSGDAGPVLDGVREAMVQWTHAHARANYPDFDVWLSLGDLAYTSGSDSQYQKSLFDSFPDQMRNLALWPVYGNHDARRWVYFRIFSLPEQAEAGGVASGTENYYSFDYADTHFVMLDSESSASDAGSAMHQWLLKDLAQNRRKWLIAVFHHPPYSKGTHDSDSSHGSNAGMVAMRENILPALEAAGVDLVLSGHSHMYERSWLLDCHYGKSTTFSHNNVVSDGVQHHNAEYIKPLLTTPHAGAVYVVAGSASKVDQGPINHPAMPVSMLEAGSLVIDIEGDQLTTRFINNKGEVKDAFSITRKAGYVSGYAGCVP
jgi:hypothetical protein